MQALEGSLRRLQTDYIDVYFNHAVNEVARLKNPEWYEFAEAAKKQGKIRFTGMSGHAGHLTECLDHALDSGKFDVILCAIISARPRASISASWAASTWSRVSLICRA